MKYKAGDIVMIYWSEWVDIGLITECISFTSIFSTGYNYYKLDSTADRELPFNKIVKGADDEEFYYTFFTTHDYADIKLLDHIEIK